MELISQLETIPLGNIENWDQNPRQIDPKYFERLKVQITKFGLYKPLHCEKVKGKYIAVGGNMRLKALKDLGFKEAWVAVVKFKNDEDRIEFSLSDNDRAGYYVENLLAEQIKNKKIDLSIFKVDVKPPDTDLAKLLEQMTRIKEAEVSEDDIKTEMKCPKCGYKW